MKAKKATTQELQREVERLRRENKRLRERLRRSKSASAERMSKETIFEEMPEDMSASHQRITQALRQHRLFATSNYPRYLWCSFRETGYYQRIRNFGINFRRYRFFTRCITIIATALTVIGTSAAVAFGTVGFLLLIPAVLLPFGGTTLLGLFQQKAQNKRLQSEIEGRTVYLFFPSVIHTPSFTTSMIRDLSERPHCVVFVVSPYLWSTKGMGGEGFYINARQEKAHCFLIRRHYFFFFRRLLDGRTDQRTVAIF